MSDYEPTSEYAQEAAEEANRTIVNKPDGLKILSNPDPNAETNLGGVILNNLESKYRLNDLLHKTMQELKIDPLTKLKSRREIVDIMNNLVNKGETFAVMYIDADYFKKVNDKYGHTTGDAVLEVIAQRMSSRISEDDNIGRMGGEEFLAVFPHIDDIEVAKNRAEEIRKSISDNPIHYGDDPEITQTVSIGVILSKSGETSKNLVERADEALYFAKENGRNRVATEADLRSKVEKIK